MSNCNVMKPDALVLIGDRAFVGATEPYLLVETELDEFWLALGCKQVDCEPLGYLHYVRCAGADELVLSRLVGTFGLQQVLPASSPVPHPIVSLSNVLWTRPAALEADQAISSYRQAEG